MLKNIWSARYITTNTKIRIFNSNVKTILLYGLETWRTIKMMLHKIQICINSCLRRICHIPWQDKVRNEDLWERAGQGPAERQIMQRKWGQIGHTLRKPVRSTTCQALTSNPLGKRRRDRPRNSRRRDTEAQMKQQGYNWARAAKTAQDRIGWFSIVDGLCSAKSNGPKKFSREIRESRVEISRHT